MKCSSVLVALCVSAAVAQGQQPPTPPTPPAPPAPPAAAAPAAPRAPLTHPMGPTPAAAPLNRYDAEALIDRFRDAADRDRDMAERNRELLERNADRNREAMERAADRNRDIAAQALERAQIHIAAPQVRAQSEIARAFQRETQELARATQTIDRDWVQAAMENGGYRAAPGAYGLGSSGLTPRPSNMYAASSYAPADLRWFSQGWSQDRDPADSLFTQARDAMNRGDWRRAADLFSQVYVKYPRSDRVVAAAYYEAFNHYRIGTTEELRTALRVLTDRAKGSTNSNTASEISILTTRVRGKLAERGDADAARQLASDAQKGSVCDNEDMQVRAEALSALAQSDMSVATPMLRRVLEKKDPCSLELRRRALSILLRRADTAATSAAIAVAKNADETLDLRTDAISYLSRLPGDNALTALEDLLRTSSDRDVQRAAMRSLANAENPKARQAVRMLIERNDVSEQLRMEAINSFEKMGGTGNSDDAAYLRGVYPKLQAERLKTAAIAAISKFPGADNEQFTLAIARNANESSDVRANAISRMYRLTGISIADIGKLYDAAESRTMRDQVINVLSQRKESEAVDKLIDIVKTGTDPRTRSQAISALMRKDDPRAKKMLADMVDK